MRSDCPGAGRPGAEVRRPAVCTRSVRNLSEQRAPGASCGRAREHRRHRAVLAVGPRVGPRAFAAGDIAVGALEGSDDLQRIEAPRDPDGAGIDAAHRVAHVRSLDPISTAAPAVGARCGARRRGPAHPVERLGDLGLGCVLAVGDGGRGIRMALELGDEVTAGILGVVRRVGEQTRRPDLIGDVPEQREIATQRLGLGRRGARITAAVAVPEIAITTIRDHRRTPGDHPAPFPPPDPESFAQARERSQTRRRATRVTCRHPTSFAAGCDTDGDGRHQVTRHRAVTAVLMCIVLGSLVTDRMRRFDVVGRVGVLRADRPDRRTGRLLRSVTREGGARPRTAVVVEPARRGRRTARHPSDARTAARAQVQFNALLPGPRLAQLPDRHRSGVRRAGGRPTPCPGVLPTRALPDPRLRRRRDTSAPEPRPCVIGLDVSHAQACRSLTACA